MGITKKNGIRFKKKVAAIKKFKKSAPKIIAKNSLNWYLLGFRKGGYQTDDSSNGWQKRKQKTKRNRGRALLVDTGALRRSLQVLTANFNKIKIGTRRIAYANRHNKGITDRLGREMPKREFIGKSKKLDANNIRKLTIMLNDIFSI